MDAPNGVDFIQKSKTFRPPSSYVEQSYITSADMYSEIYRASIEDPVAFWSDIADELDWVHREQTVIEGSLPDFRFFPGSQINVSLNCVDRHANNPLRRNKVAFFFEGENGETRSLTYLQLHRNVQKFANVLHNFGLAKGDVVSVYMQNLPETYIVLLACLRMGIIYNTVFAGFSPEALRERIVTSNAKAVICSNGSYRRGKVLALKETVDAALQGEHAVRHVIVFNRIADLATPMVQGRDYDYTELMRTAPATCDAVPLDCNDPGLLIFTSGTSGKPKGIVHAGGGFLLGTYAYSKYQLDLRDEDVYWNTADIGWLTAHIFVLVGGLALGVTNVIYEGAIDHPHQGRLYEIVERYQINKLFSAPTAFRMLMKYGEALAQTYDLSSIRLIASVGEPLNPEAWNWVYRVVGGGHAVINNTWGQTETGGTPLASLPGATAMKPGSCGVPFFGHSLDVVDHEGRPVKDGTPGLLIIRTPFPTLARDVFGNRNRYLQNYFEQIPGAYITGDSAIRDHDGHYWVLGRVDDVINVAGHRISTMEMESSLIQHESVVEAAVVAQPDAIKGTVPVAFVTIDNRVLPDDGLAKALQLKVIEDIGSFAKPERIHFVSVMPKTRSGKIMRRMLREVLEGSVIQGDITGLEDSDALTMLISEVQDS